MFEYIIIGGGITGITLGRLLQKKGNNNYLIIENKSNSGGLCRTKKVKGHYLDIGGGHFLCSKHKKVYDFIFSHIDEDEFNYFDRVSKIKLGRKIIDYPVESNLWQLSKKNQIKYLISVIKNGENIGKKEPTNYEEWCIWKLGHEISNNYLLPYNNKIWGINPSKLGIDWLNKIPRLEVEEILLSCLNKKSNKNKFPSHVGFYYPKEGGFQKIFDSIYLHVKKKVLLNTTINSIEREKDHWIINNKYKARNIINTAPWLSISKALNNIKDISSDISELQANSIVVSLWEKKYDHNWHWLYDPSLKIENHREFYIHNFAPTSEVDGTYTETNISRWPGVDKHWSNGLSPIYEHINEYAYPIPTIKKKEIMTRILERLKTINFFGVGRWGEWEYYNSDICILRAMEFIDQHQ